MDWTIQNGRMLEVETQRDRVVPTMDALPEEDCQENLKVMVMHTEAPPERTCAGQRMDGGEISAEDLRRDCRNELCITCAARDPNSGYNKKEYDIQGSDML
eukprot:10595630-Heterocapsa_arctica.AAC.1